MKPAPVRSHNTLGLRRFLPPVIKECAFSCTELDIRHSYTLYSNLTFISHSSLSKTERHVSKNGYWNHVGTYVITSWHSGLTYGLLPLKIHTVSIFPLEHLKIWSLVDMRIHGFSNKTVGNYSSYSGMNCRASGSNSTKLFLVWRFPNCSVTYLLKTWHLPGRGS